MKAVPDPDSGDRVSQSYCWGKGRRIQRQIGNDGIEKEEVVVVMMMMEKDGCVWEIERGVTAVEGNM